MNKLSNELLETLSKNIEEQNKLLNKLLEQLDKDSQEYTEAPINRPAHLKELERAYQGLLQMGEHHQANMVAEFIDACKENPLASVMDPAFPAVVRDFSDNVETNVILVPQGTYHIPESFVNDVRFFIGLESDSKDYPTLVLEGHEVSEQNADTGAEHSFFLFQPKGVFKFAYVELDAPTDTLIKTWALHPEAFHEQFLNVTCTHRIDVLESYRNVLFQGRDWIFKIFGHSTYNVAQDLKHINSQKG